ncbi:MAG: bifunctional folylpolyglutamate synthase/dihydrofolate synthase [Candidatus Omnitrophica bacterium]|nr:bifunctional folylpolyglutamate synthase/dihydrofolate synthase [Candidatus Omnitrophota bacterium]
MTYNEAIAYLDSFFNYEKNPVSKQRFFNLRRITMLADLFGNPQKDYPSVHIAGTKGKGSVSRILSGILEEAGFKTGLYTSPHILDLRERIKLNGKDISKNDLVSLCGQLKNKLKKIAPTFRPSFFEIYTILAFEYFKGKNVDFAIFETGMGGRLDATNILKPLACAITSISYDHTRELGRSLRKIAGEKAGIIKQGTPCVSAVQKKEVLKVIRDRCKRLSSGLFVVGKDLLYRSTSYSDKKETFTVKGSLGKYENLNLPLLGEHQLVNASVAVGISEILISKGYKIPKDAVRRGINNVEWPCRCEILKRRPYVILDGAHNPSSARALKQTIKRNFYYEKLILILGVSRDKDIKGICGELAPLADEIVLTKADIDRSQNPEYLKRYLGNRKATVARSITEAYEISKDLGGVNDIILVTGSMYLLGQFKRCKLI